MCYEIEIISFITPNLSEVGSTSSESTDLSDLVKVRKKCFIVLHLLFSFNIKGKE